MLVLKGNELKRYVKMSVGEFKYRRKIVVDVYNEIKKRGKYMLYSFTGDRRMGKTTSLLQLIDYFNDYDNSIFIDLEFDGSIEDVGRIIFENEGKKIFIDEVTTEKVDNLYKRLADYYSKYSEFVVMTGTWSQIFYYYQHDLLLGRNLMYRLTPITPADMKLLKPRSSIHDFIDNGGFIQDVDTDLAFRDSTDNIKNFMSRLGRKYTDLEVDLSFIFTLFNRSILNKNNYGSFLRSNEESINRYILEHNISGRNLKFKIYEEITDILIRYDFLFARLNLCGCEAGNFVPLNIVTLEKYTIYSDTIKTKDW